MLYISWESPLVQHLTTSCQPAWQPSQSLPCTCDQTLVGLKWETYHTTGECSTNWALPARQKWGYGYFVLSYKMSMSQFVSEGIVNQIQATNCATFIRAYLSNCMAIYRYFWTSASDNINQFSWSPVNSPTFPGSWLILGLNRTWLIKWFKISTMWLTIALTSQ